MSHDYTCIQCKKLRKKQDIVSFSEGSELYMCCILCQVQYEKQKLKRESKAAREARKRSDRIIKENPTREAAARKTKETVAQSEQVRLAKRELANRELARRRLLPYIRRFKPNYSAGWAHRVICARLEKFYEQVQRRESPRLMIFLSPRFGKSEIVSDKFPGWALGRDPSLQFMLISYGESLPIGFSIATRDRVMDEEYQVLFPKVRVNPNKRGSQLWRTDHDGGIQVAGVGGGITGHGSDIMIIDDPIKNYQDAYSEVVRGELHNWYGTTARTRLAPGGGIILVQTRWHWDDLAGRQLKEERENKEDDAPEEELENWDVLSLPAICEEDEYIDSKYNFYNEPAEGRVLVRVPGQALHPERFPLSDIRKVQRRLSVQQFSALYQQKPVPDTGEYFTIDDFVYYRSTPHIQDVPVYFAWDLAVGEKQHNDYTVGIAAAYYPDETVKILDMFRRRVRGPDQVRAIVEMYKKYRHSAAKIGLEYGQIFLAIEQALMREFKKELGVVPFLDRELKPVTDKRVRAEPLRGWMQHHRVLFPDHSEQPWVARAQEELLRFDAGEHDDIVDSLAWLIRMIQKEPVPVEPKLRNQKTVKEKLMDEYRRQQRSAESRGYMVA